VVFALWQLNGDELSFQQEFPFCEDVDPETVFGSENNLPTELTAWAPSPESSTHIVPATYRWNEDRGTYDVIDIQPPPELIPDYSASFSEAFGGARNAMEDGEIGQALRILDTGLLNPNLTTVEQIILLYHRALALEARNRPEEALLEYVGIYESAPESAWGILAALHLERIE
jgi:hypothetical protein